MRLSSRPALVSLSLLIAFCVAPAGIKAQGGPDIFVTPIPNAPFTGVIQVERSIVQKKGDMVDLKTLRAIGRDSSGRIFNESRELIPATSNKTPQALGLHLYDPQTRQSTMIYPLRRSFFTATVNRPPATEPPDLISSPSSKPSHPLVGEEDLGMRTMENVQVHGVRETQTIPVANGRDIQVTDEYWYSEDLRIYLVRKHNDPRTGSVTMTVTGISRTEPDPSVFEVPAGYRPGFRGAM